MLKLVSEKGRWATKGNEMVFGNVVWLLDREDASKYHLVDENLKEIKTDISKCVVDN